MRLNLIERLSLSILPSLEQFLDHYHPRRSDRHCYDPAGPRCVKVDELKRGRAKRNRRAVGIRMPSHQPAERLPEVDFLNHVALGARRRCLALGPPQPCSGTSLLKLLEYNGFLFLFPNN